MRDYDPETQTFLTEDTCSGETNDPLSLNLYTSAENDPIQNVDPTGHWIVDAVFLAVDAVSFAKKPSLAGAAWIAADVLSFADPTGAASTAAHIVKEVHVAAEVAHEAGAAKKVLEVAKKATTKGASKDWKEKIIMPEKAHTNKTDGHWYAMKKEAVTQAKNPGVEKVYLNKALSNVQQGAGRNRPDVMVVTKSGKVNQIEVASKTDNPANLQLRMQINKTALGNHAGTTRVIIPTKKR